MANLEDGNISYANYQLADFIALLQQSYDLPMFPQGELVPALLKANVEILQATKCLPVQGVTEQGYFGSREVAVEQKETCDRYKWKRIIPVSPVPHTWRAIWVYEKLDLQVIIPPNMPEMVWQKDLAQWRWQGPIRAYFYELLARLYYFYKGYI